MTALNITTWNQSKKKTYIRWGGKFKNEILDVVWDLAKEVNKTFSIHAVPVTLRFGCLQDVLKTLDSVTSCTFCVPPETQTRAALHILCHVTLPSSDMLLVVTNMT
eukprot:14554003-Ditylum_brightwellii.AAC.1